jgi:hypothetical protein
MHKKARTPAEMHKRDKMTVMMKDRRIALPLSCCFRHADAIIFAADAIDAFPRDAPLSLFRLPPPRRRRRFRHALIYIAD